METHESMDVGVVLERREVENPWIDYSWRAIAVLPGAPRLGEWVELRRGPDWVHFHAGTLPIELFRKETEGYKYNLSTELPAAYVVLRTGEEAEDHEVEPFLVTVSPYEAQDYLDNGEDLVEAVGLPDVLAAWIARFVEQHHVDEPFKKRKRLPYDPRKNGGGRRPAPPARSGKGGGRG